MKKHLLFVSCVALISSLTSCSNISSSFSLDSVFRSENVQTSDVSYHYMEVLDALSNSSIDHKNPLYVHVSIKPQDSYMYSFDGPDSYDVISTFDEIVLNHKAKFATCDEDFRAKVADGISFYVAYSLIDNQVEDEDKALIVCFRLTEDGILVFSDINNYDIYFSEPNSVSYKEIIVFIKEKEQMK